jgi:cytochrome c oxidase assembly protein subunit 15
MPKISDLASRVLVPLSGLLLLLQATLIVTGGAVRLTGSGLGCPTWPECTPGSYTPVAHQAEPILNVWIEFGNRLLGIVLGFVSLLVVIAVLKCKRKDLRIIAFGQLLGVIVQGILGGITVRTDLHPNFVAPHFLISIILIPGAVSLYSRRRAPAVFVKSSPLTNRISLAHITTAFLAIVLGTIVTGSGPHAGDAQAERLNLDIQTISWLHADAVIILLGITFAFYVAQGTSERTKKTIKIFSALALVQGGIGYVQYFTGVPEILVGAHILGATLVWIAAWRIRLSVITQNG